MSNTMNKEHQYREYRFNIKVELNSKIERKIGGKREHRVTLNDMGPSNYYHNIFVETCNLEENIQLMIKDAENWVDNQVDGNKSFEEKILASLGFK